METWGGLAQDIGNSPVSRSQARLCEKASLISVTGGTTARSRAALSLSGWQSA